MNAPAQAAQSPVYPRRSKRQAKSDESIIGPLKNYSKTPDEYLHLITGEKLSGSLQRDLIYLIQMNTWGGKDKAEWTRMTLAEMARYCPGSDRPSISRALADMTKRGLIEMKEANGSTAIKLYKLTPERWKDAPKYEPKAIKEASDDTSARRRSIGDKLLVRPHRKAACVPIRMAQKDREPVEFQIQYLNEGEMPFEVSATTEADILHLQQQAHKKQRKGERGLY
jgi:hypothetical protein